MARPTRADVPRRGLRQRLEEPLERRATLRASPSNGSSGSIGGEIRRELAAGFEIGEDQRGDFVAVGAGEHHVAHERRAMRDEGRAQRPDADPGAGRELEILGDPAVEQETLCRLGRIGEFERVADLVEAFFVEGRRP